MGAADGSAAINLIWAPDVDWDFQFTVNVNVNGAAPILSGTVTHDCYPAHELWVGNTMIYGYTPPAHDLLTLTRCLSDFNRVQTPIIKVLN